MINNINELKDFIVKTLEDKKAENITVIDLKGKANIAQFMIFASGRSTRNVAAIADFLADELKAKTDVPRVSLEGLRQSEWVLIDAGDIIVHVFHPEAREHFKLEEFWARNNN
ncbi:MAG: Iojap-related protein [Rickettsiaceae bacterium]|jgi:ribosome-associated protein|nr:Iojap-related protein [Rickettsiaceae bacterium]